MSGPLLDRMALRVVVPALDADDAAGASAHGACAGPAPESTAVVAHRVAAARARAVQRQGCTNGTLSGASLARHAALCEAASALMQRARADGRLGERGIDDVTRVARSLADLAGRTAVEVDDVAEALAFRAELRMEDAP